MRNASPAGRPAGLMHFRVTGSNIFAGGQIGANVLRGPDCPRDALTGGSPADTRATCTVSRKAQLVPIRLRFHHARQHGMTNGEAALGSLAARLAGNADSDAVSGNGIEDGHVGLLSGGMQTMPRHGEETTLRGFRSGRPACGVRSNTREARHRFAPGLRRCLCPSCHACETASGTKRPIVTLLDRCGSPESAMFPSRILKTSLLAIALCGAAAISSMPSAQASERAGIWNDGSRVNVQYVRDRIVYRNGRRVYVRDRYRPSSRYHYAPRRAYPRAYGPRVYAPSRGAYWYPERPRPGRTDRALEERR